MDRPLESLFERLLVQCRPRQVDAAAMVATAYGAGLVITGKSTLPAAQALRDKGFTGPILCDADRYSGARRVSAGRGVSPGWFRRQRELRLIPLSDSGYLAPRNWNGLRTILGVTAREDSPAVAMLPLAARWFTAAVCDALAREINKAGVPVAVAIEHDGDPFGAQYVLHGFLRLLGQVEVPLLLLRSDVSALGALCHGAHTAAIGTASALRHIYPRRPRGSVRHPGLAAFVTALLGYHTIEMFATAVDETPDLEQYWVCQCDTCHGWTPASIGSPEDAFRHSLGAQLRLRDELFRAKTREALVSTWHEHCSHALNLHEDIAKVVPRWRAPKGLRTWLTVTRDPMSRWIPGQAAQGSSWRGLTPTRRSRSPRP